MEANLQPLRDACKRAAREFLTVEGWRCDKGRIAKAVCDMESNSRTAFASMAWLIEQTYAMPVQEHAASRLHQLVHAISSLRHAEKFAKKACGAKLAESLSP